MGAIEHLTVTLSAEAAGIIRARIASGDYADEGAVIEEALAALDDVDDQIAAVLPPLDEEDPGVQAWIKAEVTAALDEYDRDPSCGMTIDEVRASLAVARAERAKRA